MNAWKHGSVTMVVVQNERHVTTLLLIQIMDDDTPSVSYVTDSDAPPRAIILA